jgi:hypothetical protein
VEVRVTEGSRDISARFLSGFPQGSTGESQRPQFLHKGEMFFGCGARRCAAEWFQRIREKLSDSLNDDCGDAGGSWRFSRVNRRGKIGNARERVNGCPGIAASSTSCSLSEMGRWPRRVAEKRFFGIANPRPVLVNVALLATVGERFRPSTVILPLLGGRGSRTEFPRNDAAPVAGWGRICFFMLLLSTHICQV